MVGCALAVVVLMTAPEGILLTPARYEHFNVYKLSALTRTMVAAGACLAIRLAIMAAKWRSLERRPVQ